MSEVGQRAPSSVSARASASVEELRAVLDNIPGMVALWDKHLLNRFANRAYIEWFGVDPARMAGMHIKDLLGPRIYELNSRYIEGALSGREQHFERTLVDTSGQIRETLASYIPNMVDGEPDGFFVLVTDVTALKNAERELQLRNDRLEELSRTKNMFIASMSHELRTPLSVILGYTDLMLSEPDLGQDQHANLTVIRGAGQHLNALIADLLDLAAIEAGTRELDSSVIDCNVVVDAVVHALTPAAVAKGLKLEVQLSAQPATVVTERRALDQIMLNLVNNAIKYTDSGTVTVEVKAARADEGVIMRVTDTGPGISPHDLEHLFEPFQRGSSPAARKKEGTGLGLHICLKLAELIGASIDVQSAVGEGTTFTLRLG